MKSISKTLIIAGTVLLFLVCILVGVLYYRNLRRGDEELAVSIERNLQKYLNERVNELNPEFLEKDENAEMLTMLSEQILKEMSQKLNKENLTWEELLQYFSEEQIKSVIEYVINNFEDDWFSQFLNEAGDIFITQEEYKLIGDEIFAALREELLKQLELVTGEEKEKILELIKTVNEYKSSSENQITGLKILLEGLQKENIASQAILEQIKKDSEDVKGALEQLKKEDKALHTRIDTNENSMKNMEERLTSNENNIIIIEQELEGFLRRVDKLESGTNLKIERWDEETQSLYLVPAQ